MSEVTLKSGAKVRIGLGGADGRIVEDLPFEVDESTGKVTLLCAPPPPGGVCIVTSTPHAGGSFFERRNENIDSYRLIPMPRRRRAQWITERKGRGR